MHPSQVAQPPFHFDYAACPHFRVGEMIAPLVDLNTALSPYSPWPERTSCAVCETIFHFMGEDYAGISTLFVTRDFGDGVDPQGDEWLRHVRS